MSLDLGRGEPLPVVLYDEQRILLRPLHPDGDETARPVVTYGVLRQVVDGDAQEVAVHLDELLGLAASTWTPCPRRHGLERGDRSGGKLRQVDALALAPLADARPGEAQQRCDDPLAPFVGRERAFDRGRRSSGTRPWASGISSAVLVVVSGVRSSCDAPAMKRS